MQILNGLWILTIILLSADVIRAQNPPSHQLWDQLVQHHVNEQGYVDYEGFINDSSKLNSYLLLLSKNPPQPSWSNNAQIAFWLNAYNAFTVRLILNYYPINGIKEIRSKIQIPFVNTPWDIKFIEIGDDKYDLNNIEHRILRKQFDEPRIHFALVCASLSCPKLRREAYNSTILDQQLHEQTVDFLNDSSRNDLNPRRPEISKIFNWFKGDFTKKGSLIDWLNKYAAMPIESKAKISYLAYDWGLNSQRLRK